MLGLHVGLQEKNQNALTCHSFRARCQENIFLASKINDQEQRVLLRPSQVTLVSRLFLVIKIFHKHKSESVVVLSNQGVWMRPTTQSQN